MASAGMKEIKRRMKSIESTSQITKAMELVASSKLRRAKQQAERTRPFFNLLHETIMNISLRNRELSSCYMRQRPVQRSCFVVIGGDRGLAGGYYAGLFQEAKKQMEGKRVLLYPIGKKVTEHFERRVELAPDRYQAEDMTLSAAFNLAHKLADGYRNEEFDEVYIVYTNFVTALEQQPASLWVLPMRKVRTTVPAGGQTQMIYDPGPEAVFDRIVPEYLAGIIYGAAAESFASEQGARRTAMETATDSAEKILDELNLRYNQARQAAITQEISEIVAGASALS